MGKNPGPLDRGRVQVYFEIFKCTTEEGVSFIGVNAYAERTGDERISLHTSSTVSDCAKVIITFLKEKGIQSWAIHRQTRTGGASKLHLKRDMFKRLESKLRQYARDILSNRAS